MVEINILYNGRQNENAILTFTNPIRWDLSCELLGLTVEECFQKRTLREIDQDSLIPYNIWDITNANNRAQLERKYPGINYNFGPAAMYISEILPNGRHRILVQQDTNGFLFQSNPSGSRLNIHENPYGTVIGSLLDLGRYTNSDLYISTYQKVKAIVATFGEPPKEEEKETATASLGGVFGFLVVGTLIYNYFKNN